MVDSRATNTTASSRECYSPQGIVSCPRLAVALPAMILLTVATVVFFAWFWRTLKAFPPVILPIAWGIGLGYAYGWLLEWAHCRQKVAAWVLCGLLGVVAYLGFYYVQMLFDAGPAVAWRFDALLTFIQIDVDNWIVKQYGKPLPPDALPWPLLNWSLFWIEMAVMTLCPPILAGRSLLRAYCETCGCWMDNTRVQLPPGGAKSLAREIERGAIFTRPVERPYTTNHDAEPYALITLEYCLHPGQPDFPDPDYYLTCAEYDEPKTRPFGEKHLDQSRISFIELRDLFQKLPDLNRCGELLGKGGPAK